MSDSEDFDLGPPSIDPYEVLGLDREADSNQVKAAYRKAALKNHPDKVSDKDKDSAKEKFQQIAFAYAILSDPTRRKRYDTTGSTEDSIIDSDDFNWSDYYREQYRDAISSDAIAKFAAKYRKSDEEKDDVLTAYEEFEGDMDQVFSTVMLSDPFEDEERFQKIIKDAIDAGEVEGFPAFLKESKKKKAARRKRAEGEGAEAVEYAKELGIHDKLFGGGGKKAKAANKEDDLAALIQKRQKDRAAGGADFLDRLADKYGAGSGAGGAGKKGKRRAVDDEPDEAAFEATAARMKAAKEERAANMEQSKKKKAKN